MANPNFVSSVMPNAISRLSDVFGGRGGDRFAMYNNKISAFARAINTRQTAEISNVMRGGKCIGVQVNYLKDCTELGGFTCDTVASALTDCNIPTGTSLQSDNEIYDPKCLFFESKSFNTDLCNNDYEREELFLKSLAYCVDRMDIRMNRYMIAQISANAQANNAPSPIGTVVGTRTEIQDTLWTSDLLVQLEIEAQQNGLYNYGIMDSVNFTYQKANSQYRSLNDNERNQKAQFDAYPNLFMDNHIDIKAVTGRNSTFFVDFDAIAFVNRCSHESQTPVEIDAREAVFAFYVVSPRTGIRYDVEYQKQCTGRDTLGNRVFDEKIMVKWIGGLLFAPPQCNGETGVLEYTKI